MCYRETQDFLLLMTIIPMTPSDEKRITVMKEVN